LSGSTPQTRGSPSVSGDELQVPAPSSNRCKIADPSRDNYRSVTIDPVEHLLDHVVIGAPKYI
jgi:hypothetical protein